MVVYWPLAMYVTNYPCRIIQCWNSCLFLCVQILFLSGVTLIIGLKKTAVFFTRKQKLRGTIFFFLGIILVFLRWPIIGMIIEIIGFVNLFGDFFPVILSFLRRVPIIGPALNMPVVSTVILYCLFLEKEERNSLSLYWKFHFRLLTKSLAESFQFNLFAFNVPFTIQWMTLSLYCHLILEWFWEHVVINHLFMHRFPPIYLLLYFDNLKHTNNNWRFFYC